MNYTICLNPASFNLANLSGNNLLIYTDDDNFTTPVASVPSSLLFPPPIGSCPYTISGIPDGATQLLIVDNCAASEAEGTVPANTLTGDCCYALIDIDPALCFDFCEDCGIGFDAYSLFTTGSIIAGSLTSSCGEVTDYIIGWYLNGDYSSPVFTSGYGTQFNYQLTHPLISSAAPLVAAGNWEGVIHDIIIAGTQYSTISGSGNGTNIPFQSCFGTTVAAPLKCDNGSFPLPYSHQKTFTAASNGIPPAPSTFTYQLSSSINYFAYLFNGQQIWDELEIKYISGNPNGTTNPTLYSQPIYLEKIKIGVTAPAPWLGTSTPSINALLGSPFYSYPQSLGNYPGLLYRTLTLTGLETSSIPSLPDKLEITVTPNTESFTTNWDLYMQCLEDFDCTNCTFDNNPPFKISNVTLERFTGNPCLQQKIQVAASGCNADSDFFTYTNADHNFQFPITMSSPGTGWVQLGATTTCQTNNTTNFSTPCDVPSNGVITFSKTNVPANGISSTGQSLGQIYMTFNNVNDFLHYKNLLDAEEASLNSIIGPITYDCTNKNYYSGYSLQVPSQAANNTCGDNTFKLLYYIPRIAYPSITYVQDSVNNFWSITIPMPELQNCLSFSGCTNCYTGYYGYAGNNGVLDLFNSSSFHFINNTSYTNNFGAKYVQPWDWIYFNTSSAAAISNYSSSVLGFWDTARAQSTTRYSQETVPFIPNPLSPGSYTNLESLGGVPCSNWTTKFSSSLDGSPYGGIGGTAYYFHYEYVFPNIQDDINFAGNDDFHLFTKVTDNSGVLQTNPLLIYSYSESIATVHQPQFFTSGTPSLTIQSF